MVPVRQRQTGGSSATECRRDAGNNRRRDTGGADGFQLFPTTPEDKRVAALEADNALAVLRRGNQQLVDRLLRHRMIALGLADRHAVCVAADESEDIVADEAVIIYDVGFLDQAKGLERQKFRIAGTCADNMDDAFGGGSRLHLSPHGGFGAINVARISHVGGRSRECTFPETAARL